MLKQIILLVTHGTPSTNKLLLRSIQQKGFDTKFAMIVSYQGRDRQTNKAQYSLGLYMSKLEDLLEEQKLVMHYLPSPEEVLYLDNIAARVFNALQAGWSGLTVKNFTDVFELHLFTEVNLAYPGDECITTEFRDSVHIFGNIFREFVAPCENQYYVYGFSNTQMAREKAKIFFEGRLVDNLQLMIDIDAYVVDIKENLKNYLMSTENRRLRKLAVDSSCAKSLSAEQECTLVREYSSIQSTKQLESTVEFSKTSNIVLSMAAHATPLAKISKVNIPVKQNCFFSEEEFSEKSLGSNISLEENARFIDDNQSYLCFSPVEHFECIPEIPIDEFSQTFEDSYLSGALKASYSDRDVKTMPKVEYSLYKLGRQRKIVPSSATSFLQYTKKSTVASQKQVAVVSMDDEHADIALESTVKDNEISCCCIM